MEGYAREMDGKKVVVGMSGGVDSAAAASLLKDAGFHVTGVTLKTWESDSSRCCEIDEARRTARKLGILYHPWNVVSAFRDQVVRPFVENYRRGLTPNPCVECNPQVKWAGLLHAADVMQTEYVATGHYARMIRLENGRLAVRQAKDQKKDQSYMLYRLTQEQLARTLLPLGEMSKEEVRKVAAKANLSVANKPESQEICFVPEGHYGDFIEKELGEKFPEGDFMDESGHVLGRHRGIIHYTVGQRKGLGIALGHPAYVKKIYRERNEIVIGDAASLYVGEIYCNQMAFMGIAGIEPGEKIRAFVRIRYHHAGALALIEGAGEDRVRITFDEPVRAPAPGQSAVFYNEDFCILGGGKIMEGTDSLKKTKDLY